MMNSYYKKGKQKNSHTGDMQSSGSISYSNLADRTTQDEVKKAMTDAGISADNHLQIGIRLWSNENNLRI